MKKLFLFTISFLLVFPMMAKTEKKWNFTVNDKLQVVVEKVYPTSKDRTTAMKDVRIAFKKQKFEALVQLETDDSNVMEFEVLKNTKWRYNPFAGYFYEYMNFNLKIVHEGDQVRVIASGFELRNKYEGYGKVNRIESFSSMIEVYEDYKAKMESGELKGKEKKEAQDTIEDTDDSFNNCQEELDKLFDVIQKAL